MARKRNRCGARTLSGVPCRAIVPKAGDRCIHHEGASEADPRIGRDDGDASRRALDYACMIHADAATIVQTYQGRMDKFGGLTIKERQTLYGLLTCDTCGDYVPVSEADYEGAGPCTDAWLSYVANTNDGTFFGLSVSHGECIHWMRRESTIHKMGGHVMTHRYRGSQAHVSMLLEIASWCGPGSYSVVDRILGAGIYARARETSAVVEWGEPSEWQWDHFLDRGSLYEAPMSVHEAAVILGATVEPECPISIGDAVASALEAIERRRT